MFQVFKLKTFQANGEVKSWHITGGVMHITWTCENGHLDQWTSSKVLCEKKGQQVFVNTMLMATAVLITGNILQFLGTVFFFSSLTFYKIQRNYVVQELLSLWEEMKKEIWAVLKNKSSILCGDG